VLCRGNVLRADADADGGEILQMHSHDRTMLANLGFADPDKKDPKHDWACQYLAELAENGKLGSSLINPIFDVSKCILPIHHDDDAKYRYCIFRGVKMEHMLSKGDGKYQTTIGFLDVVVAFLYKFRNLGVEDFRSGLGYVVFEVKINQVGIGDIIRQINLYRQYYKKHGNPIFWVIASAFQLPAVDVETLKREGIHHVFLGDSFIRWYEERSKVASRDTFEL
jgi:hypothetical protein